MADAIVRLRLDPREFQRGAVIAVQSIRQIQAAARALPTALAGTRAAIQNTARQYQQLGATAGTVWRAQTTMATNAATTIQAAGRQAGVGFGSNLASGARAGTAAFTRDVGRAARTLSAALRLLAPRRASRR